MKLGRISAATWQRSPPSASRPVAGAYARRVQRRGRCGHRRWRRGGQGRYQVRPARPRPQGGQHLLGVRRRPRQLHRQGAELHPDLRRGHLRATRDPHQDGPGQVHRRHLLDHRRAQEGRRLRRPVLHRRPGPADPLRRHLDHGAGLPRGQEALLGQGLDLGGQRPEEGRRGDQPPGVQHLHAVRRRPQVRRGRRADDRQRDPRRAMRRRRRTRASSRSSARPSPRRTTAWASRRTTPPSAPRSRTCSRSGSAPASGRSRSTSTSARPSFKPGEGNPPTPAACGSTGGATG